LHESIEASVAASVSNKCGFSTSGGIERSDMTP
jgi:hypothetical protein